MEERRDIALNYDKICQYIHCQKHYGSNRSTSKYCCSRHRALQWHINKREKQRSSDESIILENNFTYSEVSLPIISVNNQATFIDHTNQILEANSYIDEIELPKNQRIPEQITQRYDRVIDNFLDYYDLLIGIGIHIQTDEYGNDLYYHGKVHFKEHQQLDFFNFVKRRNEIWTFNKEYCLITCEYRYSDFSVPLQFERILKIEKMRGIQYEKRKVNEFNSAFKLLGKGVVINK